MRRTLVTLGVVGLFAACGFPSVTYDTSDGGGEDASHTDAPNTTEGSSGDDARDGTTGDDGASSGGDASEAGDASFGDGEASTGTDAAGDGSDSSSGADTGTDGAVGDGDATTDAPGDSPPDAIDEQPADSGTDAPLDAPADVADSGADAPPVCDFDLDTYKAAGTTCGGNDCCDTDNKAHPNQTGYFTQADACGSFDYNCNGSLDPEYASNLKCGGTGLTGCTGGSAFIGADPGCGNSALYGTCVANGILACQAGNEMTVTQGCR